MHNLDGNLKNVLVNNVTDKAQENIKAIDVYLENNKNSALGTIEERRRWFTDKIEIDSKRYEVAFDIASVCPYLAHPLEIIEKLKVLERDAGTTKEFNKLKQELRRLVNQIGHTDHYSSVDYDEAVRAEDMQRDWDDDIPGPIDYDADDYDTSGYEAEIASILGLKIDEGVDPPF